MHTIQRKTLQQVIHHTNNTFLWKIPTLPIELLIPSKKSETKSHPEFVRKRKNQTRKVNFIAQHQLDERKRRYIKRHDKRVPSLTTLQIRHRLLDRNVSERKGSSKL